MIVIWCLGQPFLTSSDKSWRVSSSSPWMKIGLDLFTLKNKKYMLIVDYYSKYIEICMLLDTSSLGGVS